MFTLKNVSGNEVDVRHMGKIVKPDEFLDVDEKLHDELEDAYVTVRTEKNITGKDENGVLVWADEDLLRAWPKAHWEKVTRKSNKDAEKEEK